MNLHHHQTNFVVRHKTEERREERSEDTTTKIAYVLHHGALFDISATSTTVSSVKNIMLCIYQWARAKQS